MHVRMRLAVTSIALAALSAACAAAPPAAESPVLEGTSWVLSELGGRALTAGTTITMRFDAGGASGTDGCNRYSRPYRVQDGTLAFGAGGTSTQMACAPETMRQASAFASSLDAARSHRIAAGRLQLLGADGAVLVALAPQSQEIAGTPWRVTAFNNGRQAVISVLAGTRLTLEFSADGRASGSAGCNQYTGTYESSGASLTLGPVATTRRMCAQPDGIMDQERQYAQALATVASARREGDRLELRTADGALAVSLTREAAP